MATGEMAATAVLRVALAQQKKPKQTALIALTFPTATERHASRRSARQMGLAKRQLFPTRKAEARQTRGANPRTELTTATSLTTFSTTKATTQATTVGQIQVAAMATTWTITSTVLPTETKPSRPT